MADALSLHHSNRRTGLIMLLVSLVMLGLAFASVPLYRLFCQATGYAGTTQRAVGGTVLKPVPGKSVSVRFDGNVTGGIPWLFGPDKNAVTVEIGQKTMAFFHATNMSAAPVTGRATFNVTPDAAGKYFTKIDCFCFTEQTLHPGQKAEMPVLFYVDPAILKDPDANKISEITLSYTFYPVDRNR
jgi:cytochrome c oxidase assembly protein subunit 11